MNLFDELTVILEENGIKLNILLSTKRMTAPDHGKSTTDR